VPAGTAAAAPLTLQVVNERGVEQASLLNRASGTSLTSGHGRAVLDVAPGEQIAVTRGAAAPEGAGVIYSVPSPVPAGPVGVTLPALPDAAAPAHDGTEAWLLAQVNAERAARGATALQQSGSLNRSADAYARHLHVTGQLDHFALADPGVRAVDQGWPFPGGAGIGEVLALAPSKEAALGAWKVSPGHWTLLMSPGTTVTGVARAGNRWVMMPSTCGPTDAPERCEIGQSGVLSPLTPPPGAPVEGGGGPGAGDKRARLRVRLSRHGRRLIVRVRLLEGRGTLRVIVRQGNRRVSVRAQRRRNQLRATALLRRRGRWKVTVRFEGGPGWADRRLVRRPGGSAGFDVAPE
jgi:uncharacterized protein YkwD